MFLSFRLLPSPPGTPLCVLVAEAEKIGMNGAVGFLLQPGLVRSPVREGHGRDLQLSTGTSATMHAVTSLLGCPVLQGKVNGQKESPLN